MADRPRVEGQAGTTQTGIEAKNGKNPTLTWNSNNSLAAIDSKY
jgi:hypothetical protein